MPRCSLPSDSDIARHQMFADLCLEPLHTFLGQARTQIPIPVRLKQMRAERVAEEVEAFLSGVSQRSFRLAHRQRHRPPGPDCPHPNSRPIARGTMCSDCDHRQRQSASSNPPGKLPRNYIIEGCFHTGWTQLGHRPQSAPRSQ
jgi:hypothetical protein